MKKAAILVFKPFQVIGERKGEFILWFLFTIITGQIGIIANIIIRSYTNSASIAESIAIDSENGNFYTFAIALVASLLGPLFINFLNSTKLAFKTLKTFTIVISIFFLFLSGLIYAAVQSSGQVNHLSNHFNIDKTQIFIYVFSIIFVAYGYCILRLENSGLNFDEIDDPLFNDLDDASVNEMVEDSKGLMNDENGIAL